MAFQDQSEFDARVADLLSEFRASASENEDLETAADASVGACYLRGGGFSGCYPDMTYVECRSMAYQLDAEFEWEEDEECR